jgi:regulator of RNase E activity RraA
MKFPVICKGIVPNVGAIAGYGHVNVAIQCAGVSVLPGTSLLSTATAWLSCQWIRRLRFCNERSLLETERILQEKIKAGATIGELVNVDEVFRTAFSYQNKALEHG